MVWRVVLLISTSLVLDVGGFAAPAFASTCTNVDLQMGGCGEVSGGGVDLGVETSYGGGGSEGGGGGSGGGDDGGGSAGSGNGGDGGGGGGDGGGGGVSSGGGVADVACSPESLVLCAVMRRVLPDDAPTLTTTPVVTTREVAHLVPSVGGMGMEPSGWMVVGLPTNFFAAATTEIVSTTLQARAAEVRFTPVSFTWDYGDGSTFSTTVAGAPWAELDEAEFSETATSHVYAAPGDYTISLTIDYAAEYRIGGGAWRSLAGTVPSSAFPLTASAKATKTVLVADDCSNPRVAPGC